MTVKLLTEQHLEFLSLKGGCTGSSYYTLVKMPHCCKSHVTAHMFWVLLSTHNICFAREIRKMIFKNIFSGCLYLTGMVMWCES